MAKTILGHDQVKVFVIVVVVGLLAVSLANSKAGAGKDCTLSSDRPCYDKVMKENVIGLQAQAGANSFEACSKNAAQNDQGETVAGTALCSGEKIAYCFEGKSNVMVRKFEGKCANASAPQRNSWCPNYTPVPYHEIYAAFSSIPPTLLTAYPADFAAFMSTFYPKDQQGRYMAPPHVTSLLYSKTGALLGAGRVSKILSSGGWTMVSAAFKSTDNGKTWTITELPTDMWSSIATSIVEDRAGVVYIGGRNAIWKSTDNGNSWTKTPATFDHVRDMLVLGDGRVAAAVDIYKYGCDACFHAGVQVSSDGGATWSELFGLQGSWSVYSMVETDNGIVASDFDGSIYKYADGAVSQKLSSWREGGHPLLRAKDGTLYYLTAEIPQGAQKPAAWVHVVVSYKSTDNGDTWRKTAELEGAGLAQSLTEGADGAVYASAITACWGGTVYKTTDDGRRWNVLSGSVLYLSDPSVTYGALYNAYDLIEVQGKILHSGNVGIIFSIPQ